MCTIEDERHLHPSGRTCSQALSHFTINTVYNDSRLLFRRLQHHVRFDFFHYTLMSLFGKGSIAGTASAS